MRFQYGSNAHTTSASRSDAADIFTDNISWGTAGCKVAFTTCLFRFVWYRFRVLLIV